MLSSHILLKCHLTIIAFHFMYGFGRLQQRTTCVFNQFQPYDNIVGKGCAGGLKEKKKKTKHEQTYGRGLISGIGTMNGRSFKKCGS